MKILSVACDSAKLTLATLQNLHLTFSSIHLYVSSLSLPKATHPGIGSMASPIVETEHHCPLGLVFHLPPLQVTLKR